MQISHLFINLTFAGIHLLVPSVQGAHLASSKKWLPHLKNTQKLQWKETSKNCLLVQVAALADDHGKRDGAVNTEMEARSEWMNI